MNLGFERAGWTKRGYVARWGMAGAVALVVACGSSSTGTGSSPLQSGDGGSNDGDGGDASSEAGFVTSLPDGGGSVDMPAPSCAQCTLRAPECVDDDTLRWFQVKCDTGACEYVPQDVHCEPSPEPPNCQDGRCRMIYIR